MSAGVARARIAEPALSSAPAALSEPAWPWPIDVARYDRTPTLSSSEAVALRALAERVRDWRRPRTRRSAWRTLDRLTRPLADVLGTLSAPTAHQRRSADAAGAAMLRMCAVERAPRVGAIAARGEYMTVPRRKSNRKHATPSPTSLPAIRPRVAGLDVGSAQHWVCGPARDDGHPNVRVFGTTTDQLLELADWLSAHGVESVAMESTHVYWIPIYELLEARGIEVLLVNARQLHNVPGRKTDFSDCQWLQLLHSCGLLRGSFRPVEAITRLRALQRQLANLVAERTRCVQWMQQSLDHMNVQVHRAVTDLTGTTGMAIVRAIVGGERDPARLATHRDRRCRKSAQEIARYLTGTWRDEHLFNLASALRLWDAQHRDRRL